MAACLIERAGALNLLASTSMLEMRYAGKGNKTDLDEAKRVLALYEQAMSALDSVSTLPKLKEHLLMDTVQALEERVKSEKQLIEPLMQEQMLFVDKILVEQDRIKKEREEKEAAELLIKQQEEEAFRSRLYVGGALAIGAALLFYRMMSQKNN